MIEDTQPLAAARRDYAAFKARGLSLDMTRGKPSPAQLDLSGGLLALPGNGDHFTEAGIDARNYGGPQGLPELRVLVSDILGAPAERIVAGNNSSLAMMHDCIVWALLKGVPGSPRPWRDEAAPTFLCPVPGYDRHFGLCEAFGIRMVPVRLLGDGPDMDEVEALAADPAVKGLWCMPKYSNPTGDIYSEVTARRLASMRTGAADFRLFWDDAYAVHHLTDQLVATPRILDLCAEAGHPDRAFVFASTSKITMAGAGVAFFAGSAANVRWFLAQSGTRSIGPDKINQLRHMRVLGDRNGLDRHMAAHRALLAPKFDATLEALERRLGGRDLATWSRPRGGYFVAVEGRPGTASRVVELAAAAGLALTPAGATWPYGRDPEDRVLRLAPSYPSLEEVRTAAEGIAICIALAGLETMAERHADA